MDEPTPPQPGPLPRSVTTRRTVNVGTQRALFLLCGLLLGAAIVLATLRLSPAPAQIVYRDRPAPPSSTMPLIAAPPGTQSPTPDKGNPSATTPTSKDHSTPKPPASGSSKVEPYNPFAGMTPPKEISGHIETGTPMLPSITPTGDTPPPSESPAPRGLLVTVRLDVNDPDAAVKGLQALAARQGGSAIQFDETASKQEPEGAVLFIPIAKAVEAQKQLASVGGVVVSDTWNGPAPDRLDKLESRAEERLRELRIQRQELLVRYLEDAPQIKHIDEDSDRIKKCLAALRGHKAGPTIAVIKVKFLA